MPRTFSKATQDLEIQLEENVQAYCPGDTVVGHVVRKVHTVSTRAWVTIKLCGRAKSKLTEYHAHQNGTRASNYRGRFNFFHLNAVSQKLFDGPVHIPPGGEPQMWYFAMSIPTNPYPQVVSAGNTQECSYLPLNKEVIAVSSPPPSFEFRNEPGWGPKFHCYVEYYLEADFREENGSHLATATLPLLLKPDMNLHPFKGPNVRTQSVPGSLQTQRLVPGMRASELSFHQKTQKFFRSSKVPKFSFSTVVEYPTAIQIENSVPIPFTIHIIPDLGNTSDTIVDDPQTFVLVSLIMQIRASTSILCSGTLGRHTANGINEHDFSERGTILGLHDSITIPSELDGKALDIGAFLGLSLSYRHANTGGNPLRQFGRIYPSFTTYNIKHSHLLKWEFYLEVAGETVKVSGEHPVSILAAS